MALRMSVCLALAASAACAQDRPVDGAAFRRFAEGWTLHFERDGRPFGAESYHPGGVVIWKPEGGDCVAGAWAEQDGAICFAYPQFTACWRLFSDARGMTARPAEGGPPKLRIARRNRTPLYCGDAPAV